MKDDIIKLMGELIASQQEKLLTCGRAFVSNLTSDDALQPNDYPQLENNPHFRYEEGILEGLYTAHFALLALFKQDKVL